ncbi:MAG TPA: ATP-binding cassette domain-containing protein [Candidatus Binatia bacterium]|nr:ATP-binding cassette domain-containing protein [Candidatus Binatia bacterium]
MIEVKDFLKVYGERTAVDHFSFSIFRGEIFGLLGPNGAGKTSTREALEGLRSADGGTLRMAGIEPMRDPQALRQLIGVVSPNLRLTVLYLQVIFLPSMIVGGLMGPHDRLADVAAKVCLLLPATYPMNAFIRMRSISPFIRAIFPPMH